MDAAIAVVLAAIVLIVSPGPAITGLVAVAIVLACMAAFAVSRRRRRP